MVWSFSNKLTMLVTCVVQRFTFPLLTWSSIVELSTTVYNMPDILTVSPTEASGHLQIPFSK